MAAAAARPLVAVQNLGGDMAVDEKLQSDLISSILFTLTSQRRGWLLLAEARLVKPNKENKRTKISKEFATTKGPGKACFLVFSLGNSPHSTLEDWPVCLITFATTWGTSTEISYSKEPREVRVPTKDIAQADP
ncbi:hypothetical protein MKW98_002988 [Papaver atlanticum]|uniref:Uncharacterized protein n=1 Tax=Papaver atlanticum TaxID=357466 RepID=A0AAD4XZ69_9MAGN|nr:hypothetical protein MKW98_002988 [Papaver atlanticum]